MKTVAVFMVGLGLVVSLMGLLPSPATAFGETEEHMEKVVKTRQKLYQQFLPSPEELGPGWLLPWQIPESVRKFAGEEAFWQSYSEDSEDTLTSLTPIITSFVGVSAPELNEMINLTVSLLASEMEIHIFFPGVSEEQVYLAMLLFLLRMEMNPALAQSLEQAYQLLEEAQKVMREQITAEEAAEDGEIEEDNEIESDQDSSRFLELFLKPVRGMTVQQIRQRLIEEITSVRKMTSMSYAKCDNWDALRCGEMDPSQVHLGEVTVKLLVLNRDRMEEVINDLEPEEVGLRQQKLGQALAAALGFALETEEKEHQQEIEELEEALNEYKGLTQQEIYEVPQRLEREKEGVITALRKSFQEKLDQLNTELRATEDSDARKSVQTRMEKTKREREESIRETEERFRQEQEEIVGQLKEKLRDTEKLHHQQVQELQEEFEEEFKYLEENLSRMGIELYVRDFGDNCYVVHLKTQVQTPESMFPFGDLNACLRNGNAVVHIGLRGNFTAEQFKQELDHFLSEMDARTAFFRE